MVRSRLALLLCGLGLAAATAVVVFDVLDRARIHSLNDTQPIGVVLGVTFSILGVAIVTRQPANRIGWIYLCIGILTPLQSLAVLYYERSLIVGGLPAARWDSWFADWASVPVYPAGLALFAFLLFPDGHLPSRRWRHVAWLALSLTFVAAVLSALQPGKISPQTDLPPLTNPLGVGALRAVANANGTVLYLGGTLLLAIVIGGLVVRGRRTGNLQERQQIKLLAYSATVTISVLLILTAVSFAHVSIGNALWSLPIVFGFGVAVPVACGIAILRHGLYEIDRLISRTISYAILTAAIVAVFGGLVLVSTRVLPLSSPVGVAASTLAAAALFNPLRRRLQQIVDRRFNRTRYKADVLLADFTDQLRSAVDPEAVQNGLLATVSQAVAPAHASVWLNTTALTTPDH